ncbi:FAD-dependent oxidoreductase [Sinirhodobacter populi]|uniref:FAD-dependent oxidoreductase n=1 Tax=Paenirhodobacter populi TaxID=2306993 RepID=A0A443ILG6_9RHOB|nr:FAD-dependent oxidoreductase [Sinirhodobacter populi]
MSEAIRDIGHAVNLDERHAVGVVRSSHPVYVDLMPPCNDACPAGENIQAWLDHARAGDWHGAWQVMTADNPFPAIHGRVCYHPCEGACNRGSLDGSVSIHAIERYIGDLGNAQGWKVARAPATGKKVLVVGAGPSGLSAAWHLAVRGHEVTILEAGPIAGGMMRFAIPAYRLPRDILAREVARVEELGVRIVLDHRVADILAEQRAGGYDAVYLAIGAQVGRHVDIPARDAARVMDALDLLRAASQGEKPLLGRRVAIYGGGNTAMDAARTARRLGASDAMIIYRRDAAHMPAHAFEAQEAEEEGITFKWLSSIKDMTGEDITVEKMAIDDKGKVTPTGEYETLKADSLVLALGQTTDVDFLRGVPGLEFAPDGTLIVGEDMQTGHPGLFAGGDVTPATRSVTNAVGLGKHAARHIDAWLNGTRWEHPPRHPLVSFDDLHLPIFDDALKAKQAETPIEQRTGFQEVMGGLTEAEALHEAGRCLSCGNCYECDNCYAACPEDAITKLGPGMGYSVNLSLCTGCRACFEQCPCHAIDMVPESAPVAVAGPSLSEAVQ